MARTALMLPDNLKAASRPCIARRAQRGLGMSGLAKQAKHFVLHLR
jgi:hypothetical protein